MLTKVCTRCLCYCWLVEEEEKLPKLYSVSRYSKPEPVVMPTMAHAIPVSIIDIPDAPNPPVTKNKQGIVTPSVYHSREVQIGPVLIKH